jgi:hypothetical protein
MQAMATLTFNILIKTTLAEATAHCLELDIVATAPTEEAVKADIVDLIKAQVLYAFANDNLDHLYHPAPPEAWREFFRCTQTQAESYPLDADLNDRDIVPPWIIANTCRLPESCHV